MMYEELSGKIYCGYYDIAVMLCEENQDCPEELDDEEDDDDGRYIDEKYLTDSDVEYY